VLTPKQQDILDFVNRYGKNGISAMDIGVNFGFPRKKAEKWAKPGLKELVKGKHVQRIDELYYPANKEEK
jgi:hypothetical protein